VENFSAKGDLLMGREVHFVIAVDVDTKRAYIDDETYTSKFDSSQGYFDTRTDEWQVDEDRLLYDIALGILNSKSALADD
jgi:hypothetical protein